MPVYISNDEIFDIPQSKAEGFEARFPEAEMLYQVDGKEVGVPLKRRDTFLSQHKEAKPFSYVELDLEDAYKERDRLQQMGLERRKQLQSPMGSFVGGMAPISVGAMNENADEELKKIYAASNANDKRIEQLEAIRDGKENNFFRAFGNTITSPSVMTLGITDLNDASAKLSLANNIEEGNELSETDRILAHNLKQQGKTQARYEDDMGWMYRAGEITAHSIPFMAQIGATGGFTGLTKLGAEGAKGIIRKATGMLADDLIASATLANTLGAGGTMSNILDRKVGRIDLADDNYSFVGGTDWAEAIYKGEVSSILEYYTEKLGGHLEGAGGKIVKGLDNLGLKKVSKALAAVGDSKIVKGFDKLGESIGYNGYLGEVMEEEANIVLNAALVGDNKFSDLVDGRTQTDIWGGLVFSSGFMELTPRAIAGGLKGATYLKLNHNVNKSDRKAASMIGEEWGALRGKLEEASNDDIADVFYNEVLINENLTMEQKDVASQYVSNLLKLRGFNTASLSAEGNEVGDAASESYLDGYNATDGKAVRDRLEAAKAKVRGFYESDEGYNEFIERLREHPAEAVELYMGEGDTERAKDVLELINAQWAYDGMQQRVADDADSEIATSDAYIDKVANKDGSVVRAQVDGRNVFVKGGNSDMAVVIDEETGEMRTVAAEMVTDYQEAVLAADEKAARAADIKQRYANKADAAMSDYAVNDEVMLDINGQQIPAIITAITDDGLFEVHTEVSVNGLNNNRFTAEQLNGLVVKQSANVEQEGTPTTEVGQNGAQPVKDGSETEMEPANVPDYFRLDGVQYNVVARNDDGSVDAMADGKRVKLPAGQDYSMALPTDKKGVVQFTELPVTATVEYFTARVDDAQARAELIENNRKAAEKELAKYDKRPNVGTDPDAYAAVLDEWKAKKAAAQAKVDYWAEVAQVNDEVQRSDTREAINENIPVEIEQTPDEFVAGVLGGIKITPESFRRETGLGGSEQRALVGVLTNEADGGVSVERAAEIIMENYADELAGLGFTGDVQDMRDMIINILSNGNPRSYAKKGKELRAQELKEQRMSQLESIAAALNFESAEEMALWEETVIPAIIVQHQGFDENEYYTILADEYNNNSNNDDTTRTGQTVGGSSDILQGEQLIDNGGTESVADGQQGGAIPSDVQGGGQDAAPQAVEQVADQIEDNLEMVEPVGISEQLPLHNENNVGSSEIPNNQATLSQESEQVSDQDNAPYTIAPAHYTTKKGKVLDMHLVKFAGTLTKEQQRAAKELAKADKGWYDREQGGFMMRSEESAKQLADTILNNDDAVSDAQPVSLADTRKIVKTEQQVQPTNPSGNRLVTDERYAELRERMRKKLGGQMNIGIDPEILAIGTEMAVYHLEKGARKFTEYAKAMIADLGDVIRPYLKAFYNGARELPEVIENGLASDMTSYDEVQSFDVANFDKQGIDAFATAETVTREAEVAQEVEVAQERIKKTRSAKKETKKKSVTSQQSSEMGLFDGLFDNETNNDNGLQRTDAERSEGVSANGNRHEQGLSRGTETSSESEQQGSRGTDLGGERTGDAVDRTVRPRLSDTVEDKGIEGKRKKDVENNRKLADELKGVTLFVPDTFGVEHELSGFTYYELENVFHFTDNINGQRNATRKELDAILKIARKNNGKEEISEPKNTRNNHSERGKDHAPTSVDARIEANIKAIELAKQLLESGEQATEKQMQTLRKFSGWGGLGKAFSEGTYYAPNLIAKRLRELLGEAAYQEAVMSANSAYYTPAYVVDTLWDIAEQMGFKGGNILEGSAGIGNILGQMPTHISERSNIHAIEIDGTSGGILSLLYPDAKVEIQGFEETRIANGSVDLAITNVPFVTGLRVNDTTGDKDLSKKFHNIHDFCIAKNVRKLREGGLGIFITSNGTLDNSKKLRDWIVNEGGADFVGAFRMHNKTFGGTGVTSDIIVIRKRVNGKKSANAIDVSTVTGERMAEYDTGETRKVKGQIVPVVKQLSMDYNQYFVEHPENMAGEMHFAFEKGDTFRPTSKGLYPKQEKKQEQMLAEFVQSFTAEEFGEKATDEIEVIDAMPGKKIGEVFVSDGKLYINAIGAAQPLEVNANKVKGHTKVECFEAYSAIKEALAAVLEYQITHEDDKGLKPLLAKLNKAYDDFVATYGHFNKNTAIAFLRNDVDYANVFALEKFEESADAKGNKVQKFGKTDVFSKRVIEKEAEPMPTNVKDGIVASIFKFGRVDIPYIAEQLGKSEAEVKAEIIESGYGFEDPATRQVEVSYQYLSGNVREKLRQAQENNENGEFDRNIKALQEVMPMTIPAHLIDFTLGSSWIEPKLYEEYVKERTDVGVQFTAVGGTWFMNEPYYTAYEKNRAMGVTSEMLGRTVMGHTLIEAAIQNKSITVSTVKKNWDGSTETITDKEATQACSAKIDEIRQDFKEWARQKMQSDAEMSERMERVYNDTFNNYVPMSIPDEFVPEYFGGASHKFKMRSHQGRAIVRGTMQPLLLAHEVGTGKTFTLISTAMEMRRLGTARKPMIVVQNATVGQFVASAKELYPNAKILTLEEADRSADGRKNFYAKIKYNDWDMIVVPQSTFEFIPDSEERQMAFVQEKIEEKMLVLEQMKEADPDGKSMITRQAEREIALLEEELAGLSGETGKKRTANDEKKRAVALQNAEVKAMEMLDRRTDDVENFDDMGIDALLIDEAHEYKHLGFATAMQRGVKGVDPSYSKKSQGVFLKTQAVLEKNNGRNVIFATGTPISNTAAEIWTFMRYLMPADTMKEYGIYYFDDFVRNFGNIQQMLEFTTSGKFKENNRFAGYVNLPELVRIWSGVSDTVLTKEAGGVSDKIPDMEGGKAQDLYLPQTRALRSIMKYVKAELERYDKMSGKEKKENSHIPLTMYGIAKAAAVDARLVQSDAEDDAQSKTNEAVRQTLRSLKESADYKGTVAIFADNYQNKESGFNLYEDIRTKLIEEGVPADEIVVIKSGMTVKKKLEIFEKVNRGEVRVILGSTFTLGTGVNIQERLYTLIHLDAPNRPMDYTQRNGRILRQGNLHKAMGKPVRVLRFGVEDSLDVTAYQRLKTKGAIADSIMNGKQMMANSMTNRVLEEEEDVFGDTVAQLSGSEYAMLKNNAEKNVRKYASRKKQWEADQTYIHNAKPRVKAFIKDAEKRIEDNSRYLEAVRASFPDGKFKEIVIGKHRFATIEAMEDFFKEHNKSLLAEMKQMKDGDIAGEQKRQLTIQIGDFSFVVTTKLTRQTVRDGATLFNDVERKMTYSCAELGIEDIPVRQNLLRNAIEDITNNVITGRDFAERVEIAERVKKHNETELEQLLSREGKPFEYEAELEQAQTQYEEFSELMKKELAEKEAKYAEMDATVEAANDLATAEEADELEREGDGAYTDDEVSFENDPISKVLGKPRFTRKQRREFAERERQRMVARVENLAKKLNLDNVEIVTDASTLEGKKQRAKGFYTKSTGKITIVIPNHSSTFDVEQTLLHEAVAHYGLRQLFGEHFDTFLDNVYYNASEEIRAEIDRLAMEKYDGETRTATEEYLASLAENTNFENAERSSWWQKIKRFFVDMLAKAGVKLDAPLTDNELRYILWRSYENLAEPGRYRSIIGEAADIAKQYDLGVGNYAPVQASGDMVAERDILNREGTATEEFINATILASNWSNIHKGAAPCTIIQSAETLRAQLENAGFVEEDILSAEESYKKGFLAEYFPTSDKVVIYDVNASEEKIIGYLWHENAHKAIREIYSREEIERVFDLYFGEAAESVRAELAKMEYEPEMQAEEGLVRVLENYTFDAKILAILERGKFTNKEGAAENVVAFIEFIKPIVKFIKDGEGKNPRGRGGDNTRRNYRKNDGVASGTFGQNGRGQAVEMRNSNEATQENRKDGTYVEEATRFRKPTAQEIYNEKVNRIVERNKQGAVTAARAREAYVDSMESLKVMQDAIAQERGRAIQSNEDAYTEENHLSSKNKIEMEAFSRDFSKPLQRAIAQLQSKGADMKDILHYLIAKHGLERNRVFSQRDAEKDGGKWNGKVKDYSGLTELTNSATGFTALAEKMVADFEANYNTAELWKSINAATKWIWNKEYNAGMMTKEQYALDKRFQYYVPLRGWDVKEAADEYEYLTSSANLMPLASKKAQGRKSVADNPIANILYLAQSVVVRGNRNIMKQKVLNLAENSNSPLLTVHKMWYESTSNGWTPVFPQIPQGATADQINDIVEAFEADMKVKQKLGLAKQDKTGLNIGMPITKPNEMEHIVRVMRAGREYVIYVNGNPRAAQAVNGLLNPEGVKNFFTKLLTPVKQFMGRAFTSMNPAFMITNLVRDIIWAESSVIVKEGWEYAQTYNKVIAELFFDKGSMMPGLMKKWENGTLDRSIPIERDFEDFLRNGGETGFTQLLTVDDYKKDVERFLSEADGNKAAMVKKGARAIGELVEFGNRCVEDTVRFAIFRASRQSGRDIMRSIHDAKEITVNFNKKGSGGMGAAELNVAYLFFNAAVQSTANFARMAAKNPKKTTAMLAVYGAAGMLAPILSAAMGAIFGGDDDDYWDLPEWTRRNNICLRLPGCWLTIPLPHELRPFYGLGEICASVLFGKEDVDEGVKKAGLGFADMLPLDFTGNGGDLLVNLTPTALQPIVQVSKNVDFFGVPIYKDYTHLEYAPEWKKTYKGTSQWLVDGTKWLSDISGGHLSKGGVIDLNPAIIEHLFEGYLGGMGKTFNRTAKSIEMLWNEDVREMRNVPIVSSFVQQAGERTKNRQVESLYHKVLDEFKESSYIERDLRKEYKTNPIEAAKLYKEFAESMDYKRWLMIKEYDKAINKIDKVIRDNPNLSPERKTFLENRELELKTELFEKLEELEDKFKNK